MNPVKHALLFNAILCLVPIVAAAESKREESSGKLTSLNRPVTGVHFRTGDANLQRIYDSAKERAARNIRDFAPQMRILAEGAGYNAAWIESQPMGGAMYAKRNLDVAINNQLIFMDRQRKDGRLPGAVKRLEDLAERIRRLYGVLPSAPFDYPYRIQTKTRREP